MPAGFITARIPELQVNTEDEAISSTNPDVTTMHPGLGCWVWDPRGFFCVVTNGCKFSLKVIYIYKVYNIYVGVRVKKEPKYMR